MLVKDLLVANVPVWVGAVESCREQVTIQVSNLAQQSGCPQCQTESRRPHSYYYRHPADFPVLGVPCILCMRIRRFFCDNSEYPKRRFAEQLPELVLPRSRRTNRLTSMVTKVGFEVSSESGARILVHHPA